MSNNTKEVITIYCTNDYSIFKNHRSNREVKSSHKAQILRSLKRKNLLKDNPILIDSKNYILDGQARLECAKELDLPIYYRIAQNSTIEDIPSLQIAVRWTKYDYLNHFIKEGNKNYIKFEEFMKESGFKLNFVEKVLTRKQDVRSETQVHGYRARYNKFENGDFKYPKDDSHAWQFISCVKDFKKFYSEKIIYDNSFLTAYFKIWLNIDKYNHNKMMEKIENFTSKLIKCADINEYFKILVELYNAGIKRQDQWTYFKKLLDK